MTTSPRVAEILEREYDYLDAVQRKDGDAAAEMTASESLVVSGNGPMRIGSDEIRQMVGRHNAKRQCDIVEESVEAIEVTDDVAIISYKLRTTNPGSASATEAFDTDVWVRREGNWVCALHVETPAPSYHLSRCAKDRRRPLDVALAERGQELGVVVCLGEAVDQALRRF